MLFYIFRNSDSNKVVEALGGREKWGRGEALIKKKKISISIICI